MLKALSPGTFFTRQRRRQRQVPPPPADLPGLAFPVRSLLCTREVSVGFRSSEALKAVVMGFGSVLHVVGIFNAVTTVATLLFYRCEFDH